jgi:hypothetical protein
VSKLGSATAFGAEAALWIAGAALIASAAGVKFDVQLPAISLGSPAASHSAATASGGSAKPSAAASPTISPIVQKYQAFMARPDLQLAGTLTADENATFGEAPIEITMTGTISYKAGDSTDSRTVRTNGIVTLTDTIDIGTDSYSRVDDGAWTKSARTAASVAMENLMFSPTLQLVDRGAEVKNGAELHRLEIVDTAAFSKAMLKTIAGATDAQYTYTIWVKNDGTPAVLRLAGWQQAPINGVSTRIEYTEEDTITATSGVTITAPI